MDGVVKYPKDTAGRCMTSAVPLAHARERAEEVLARVRERANEYESINYIYVVTAHGELVGVVSLKELMRLSGHETLHVHGEGKVITVHPHTDEERVANIALEHNIKAVPVVGKGNRFLGVVSSDTILDVLHREHTEDVMRFAGVTHEAFDAKLLLNTSLIAHIRSRLPWLVLGLVGGVGAAVVVEHFEGTLAQELVLVAFIPAIVYIADAVGSQTQMLFIRALTVDSDLKVSTYLMREVGVNAVLASILSGLAFLVSYAWLSHLTVSSIVGISIFLTVCVSVLIAILLPTVLHLHGFDPAVASGPLATVLRDILSLCVYLAVASFLLV